MGNFLSYLTDASSSENEYQEEEYDFSREEIICQQVDCNRTNYSVFVILGNQYGDEGKGKVMRRYLVDGEEKARYCIRFNGGPNAGHTLYVDPTDPDLFINPEKIDKYDKDIKFATHQVPSGVIFGIKCKIGHGCVLDLKKMYDEIITVSDQLGVSYKEIAKLINISPNAHLILPEHVEEDNKNNKVGTTGSGIGPVYSDKALRCGLSVFDFY